MNSKFFDSCVLISTAYKKNIDYTGLGIHPDLIDANTEECFIEYNNSLNKITSEVVKTELLRLLSRREISHSILINQLGNTDHTIENNKYHLLKPNLNEKKRDLKWIKNKYQLLKRYPNKEDLHFILKNIFINFELNIYAILDEVNIPKIEEKDKTSKIKIMSYFNSVSPKKKPNYADIEILSEAIVYNTFYEKVMFITKDSGYNSIENEYLDSALTYMDPELDSIKIKVIPKVHRTESLFKFF